MSSLSRHCITSSYLHLTRHYAGDVTYAITGFMDKNKDSLWQDLKRLLHASRNASLAAMWPEGGAHIQKVRGWLYRTYLGLSSTCLGFNMAKIFRIHHVLLYKYGGKNEYGMVHSDDTLLYLASFWNNK